jgi:uncharacterized membrane protein
MKFLKDIIVSVGLLIALMPALITMYITIKLFSRISPFLTHLNNELYYIYYNRQKLSAYQEELFKKFVDVSFDFSMLFWICLVVYLSN